MRSLDTDKFVKQGEIITLIDDFQRFREANKITYSDLVDNDGHEYVDLVMEGGGVLGFALVGYTYFLEATGFRFLRIGGTSAGAINALALAVTSEDEQKTKSEKVLDLLAAVDIRHFVDGDNNVQKLIEFALKERSQRSFFHKRFPTVTLLWDLYSVKKTVESKLGLNPGQEFHKWLKKHVLRDTNTVSALRKKMHLLPPLHNRLNGDEFKLNPDEELLKIVAADVTTESKVVFPEMARLYWEDPDQANPADFVRASMSIPIFFQPMRRCVPQDDSKIPGDQVRQKWVDCVRYKGTTPQEAYFVDGGIISNFPINLFHRTDNKPPLLPTFGARLSPERDVRNIDSPTSLLKAVFDAARHTLDQDFVVQHPDYEQLVSRIDTGGHNWLNFDMSNSEKYELFRSGVQTAATFLKGFSWENYKEIRRSLSEVARKQNEYRKLRRTRSDQKRMRANTS